MSNLHLGITGVRIFKIGHQPVVEQQNVLCVHREYSQDIVLTTAVTEKDVLRLNSSLKLVMADDYRLLLDLCVFCLSLAVQASRHIKSHSTPIHPHPTSRCQRRRWGSMRRSWSSSGQCGGTSWHLKVTFQNASVVLRSQTSQGQFSR